MIKILVLAILVTPFCTVAGPENPGRPSSDGSLQEERLIQDDGKMNPNVISRVERSLRHPESIPVDVVGRMFVESQIEKWNELKKLDEAQDLQSFVEAVRDVAQIRILKGTSDQTSLEATQNDQLQDAIQMGHSSNDQATALRVAGMISVQKPFISFHGVETAIVSEFHQYVSRSHSARQMIDSRQWGFRDRFLEVLMYIEAMSLLEESVRDETLEEALYFSSIDLFREIQAILSFTRLSLKGVIDILFPVLRYTARDRNQVLRIVHQSLADRYFRYRPNLIFKKIAWKNWASSFQARRRFGTLMNGCERVLSERK